MADIKAIFKYAKNCKRKIFPGIRPAVKIKSDYLTTCLLTFTETAEPSESFVVLGTFITPEFYPNSLWVGKIIEAYEGSRLLGYLTVTEILNPILKYNEVTK